MHAATCWCNSCRRAIQDALVRGLLCQGMRECVLQLGYPTALANQLQLLQIVQAAIQFIRSNIDGTQNAVQKVATND